MDPNKSDTDAPGAGGTRDDLVEQIRSQNPVPLNSAGGIFAEFLGERPHPSTIRRWKDRGYTLPDGTVVRLGAIRCGGVWVTSRAQIEEFIRAQQPARAVVPVRSRSSRGRDAAKATAELKRAKGL